MMTSFTQSRQAQAAVLGGAFRADLAPRTAQGAICVFRSAVQWHPLWGLLD